MVEKTITIKDLLTKDNVKPLLKEINFEKGMKLLEELVSQVESGTLPLDVAVSSYERGALLIAHLRDLLKGAEAKLEVLKLDDGGE